MGERGGELFNRAAAAALSFSFFLGGSLSLGNDFLSGSLKDFSFSSTSLSNVFSVSKAFSLDLSFKGFLIFSSTLLQTSSALMASVFDSLDSGCSNAFSKFFLAFLVVSLDFLPLPVVVVVVSAAVLSGVFSEASELAFVDDSLFLELWDFVVVFTSAAAFC